MKFTQKDACSKATDYFKAGLDKIKKHPIFLATYTTAICMMSLVSHLSEKTETREFQDFCLSTVSGLWLVATAGDGKTLKPEGYETMWRTFHKFRLAITGDWNDLLHNLGINEEGQHIHIVCQYLLQAVLQAIIEERNQTDKPMDEPQSESTSQSLSPEEEQVLRYVSGYIPFSLSKKLKTQCNETAQTYYKFLKTWQVSCSDTAKTFLQYTQEWINKQNRGGLFKVSDGVYLLFRAMEQETNKYLTKENMINLAKEDIQTTLMNNILTNRRVQTYWCSLTQGKINGDTSTKLLNLVIKKWIKIRAKAFIKVYLDLKKSSGTVGKKAEKALRKDL